MLNTAILIGRLCSDPELRHTQNDIAVTSFTLAVDRQFSSGEEKETDFINIVAWRARAEFITRNFKKGQLMALEGSIQTRKYTDKDGNNRTAFEVVANNVHFCGGKSDNAAAPAANTDPLQTFTEQNAGFVGTDEELPF